MTSVMPSPTALRPRQAAQYVGLSEASLARKRFRGEGPAYVKRGRLVYYPISCLDAWMCGEELGETLSANG
ncbi:helix-turn-helix domain-containing protein [Mycobacterium koreense]|uniref:Uncharacterized protein n=1 Tax=Mycolicibacillus koreensis TaxID=1069220 RepID=A0A7I7SH59_9MYCO|nr:helix-turn-helix domain-containing protein [Mycolicibacillus koreensis]MCV7247925.1 helix-turn-helix domain-containing protein [Mycolicibacillus koreensis]OSC24502.1 hypothetical protein B8W67_19510 [Mycolicibacillus koreensis]BBY56168.1 hypothetical protein MKOR_34190 [Mycolicibacillus koreensis]